MTQDTTALRDAPEAHFRTSAKPALVPIAGGRAVPLQRTGNYATLVTMGVWVFGMTLAMSLNFLSGHVPDAALGAMAWSIIGGSVVTSIVVSRRSAAAATRWVVHFDDARVALEDRRTGAAFALSRENTDLGAYHYTTKYGSGVLPTVVLALAERALVVGAPVGMVATHEHIRRSRAANCNATDPAVWEALRRAATLPPE